MIRNDDGVKNYVLLKKNVSRFIMYHLCITTMDKSIEEVVFDGDTRVVVCVEVMKSGALSLSVVETKNEYSINVHELKVENFISDIKNK